MVHCLSKLAPKRRRKEESGVGDKEGRVCRLLGSVVVLERSVSSQQQSLYLDRSVAFQKPYLEADGS